MLADFAARLRAALADDAFARSILIGRWAAEWDPSNPMRGHCAAASEALYFLAGGPRAGLVAWSASYLEGGGRASHWWLRDAAGAILDPTRAQVDDVGEIPPYQRVLVNPGFHARIGPRGFQGQRRLAPGEADPWGFGRRPSRRAASLLARLCFVSGSLAAANPPPLRRAHAAFAGEGWAGAAA